MYRCIGSCIGIGICSREDPLSSLKSGSSLARFRVRKAVLSSAGADIQVFNFENSLSRKKIHFLVLPGLF